MEEYFVYFSISELNSWKKRAATQPQTIYSVVPKGVRAKIRGTT